MICSIHFISTAQITYGVCSLNRFDDAHRSDLE